MTMGCFKGEIKLKFNKWISVLATTVLATSLTITPVAKAENTKTIADESIYDLLVDRYFNGTDKNDLNVNAQDPSQFAGGDFNGILQKLSLIKDMGFTIVSLGPVFATEKYDGTLTTSYSEFEPHFGTAEEFTNLVTTLKQKNMRVMIDFPLTNVSENHEWTQDPEKVDWIVGTSNGLVRWDLKNQEVQQALINAIVEFVSTYPVGGVRLTNLDIADAQFLNDMISAIKEVDESIYIISDEESDANFDATYFNDTNEIFRSIYINVDQDSSEQLKYIEPFVNGETKPTQIMFDNINTDRFIMDVEAYPPTRLKVAIASTLLLPGLPVMQYGTEIAMNGAVGPESHQLYNFRTDEELVDFIENIQLLKNSSDTLRGGEFKLLKNENGLLAFMRSSEEEKWIVVINNTSKTKRIDIPKDLVGEGKEIQAMLDSEVVRVNNENVYPLALDREVVEIYQVIDERGINIPYLIALGFVYLIFISFIVALMRRSKRNRKNEDPQNSN